MAVNINELYRCKHCGIVAEILHSGSGEPVCCGEPMVRLEANSNDAKVEKHVPIIRRYGNICQVIVGSEPHPMTLEHHIEWLEIHFNSRVIRHLSHRNKYWEHLFQRNKKKEGKYYERHIYAKKRRCSA